MASPPVQDLVVRAEETHGNLWMLGFLSLLSGAATGLLVSGFKLTLGMASRWRDALLADAHHLALVGFVTVIVGCAAAAGMAAWMVRRFSRYASGSGVPEVEATLRRVLPPAPLRRILLIKFVGGVLSIGSGMAVGPEGPGVQMGAVSARLLGTLFRRGWTDLKALIAAGAGAGIAVAFNAPIAGAVFVLEERVRRFEVRIAIAGLGASSTAILVSRLLLGNGPLFHVVSSAQVTPVTGPLPFAAPATWPLYLALGILIGAVAALYNKLIIGALSFSDRLRAWPFEAKAALVGAIVGAVGWFSPGLLGSGDAIMQRALAGGAAAGGILVAFAVRFLLSGASYAARVPGGLFAPLLAIGALLGLLFGTLCEATFPALGVEPQAFALVGMAAFFTGVVRAPVTGIVLAIEMTAAFSTFLPMLVACFAAMLAATLLRSPPIYDSLRRRLARQLESE
jgi:CIC family chloride channel protein